MDKKNLTSAASNAAAKFFSSQNQSEETPNLPAEKIYTNVPHKSKHYEKRGKREIRHGLLLDRQLKDDLTMLCHVTGSHSINDYIVSLLIDHTESPENQALLSEYRRLKNR